VIWGLSSGLAASGLWAGLAAGERKKVLIVLDLLAAAAAGVFELTTASEPLHLGGRRAVNMISLREPAASSAEFSRRVRGQRLVARPNELASRKGTSHQGFVLEEAKSSKSRRSDA
jgi:hypothetical protein